MIKNRWLYFVIAALTFMAVVNTILVSSAIRSSSPGIEPSPYDHGMDFEKDIKAMTLAKELKIDFEVTNQEANQSQFRLIIDSALFENLGTYRIKCIRPSMASLDREISSDQGPQKNIVITPPLNSGLWLVEFYGSLKDGREVLIKKSIIL